MNKLGLVGGISWISTIEYYKLINEGINEKLGGLHFAECIIYSFNYADIKKNNDANDWDATLEMICTAAQHLKNAGAQAIVLCANTMHVIAERLEQRIGLPVIHIASVTAEAVKRKNVRTVGLLGTRFTMELDFFKSRLIEQNIRVIIPAQEDRDFIHQTIFDELGKGLVKEETRQRYLLITQELIEKGAEGIILGCTEIPMLIQPPDVPVVLFDTLKIHAAAAVDFALN